MVLALILRFIDSLRVVESSISHQGEGTNLHYTLPPQNLHKIPNHILPILIRQPRVQRQGHFVDELVVGVGIVLDVEAQGLVGRHHRQGLVVDVAGHTSFGHLDDDFVAFLQALAEQAGEVEVAARSVVFAVVVEHLHGQVLQRGVIGLYDLAAAGQQTGITLELRQADARHDVGHIAFVIGRDDVVLPRAELGLGQGVFVLAVERQQLEQLVKGFVVDAVAVAPGEGAAFGRGEVLHGVDRE